MRQHSLDQNKNGKSCHYRHSQWTRRGNRRCRRLRLSRAELGRPSKGTINATGETKKNNSERFNQIAWKIFDLLSLFLSRGGDFVSPNMCDNTNIWQNLPPGIFRNWYWIKNVLYVELEFKPWTWNFTNIYPQTGKCPCPNQTWHPSPAGNNSIFQTSGFAVERFFRILSPW